MLSEAIVVRFWDKVITSDDGTCWNWSAGKFKSGYGAFSIGGITYKAHRVSAYLAGLIPSLKSLTVCDKVLHICDNPSCVNPSHFFIGSVSDNNKDASAKNRSRGCEGEKHYKATISDDIVLEMLKIYEVNKISQRAVCRMYNVNPTFFNNIVKGLNRKYLKDVHGR